MQYKVPQNIDQEDKILGPLTFTQFIYVLIGGGITLLEFSIFDTALFLLLGIPTVILTICFSLIKVQDQPFSHFFVSLLVFLRQPKNRIWQDQEQATATHGLGASHAHDVLSDTPPVAAAPLASRAAKAEAPKKVLAVTTDQTPTAIPLKPAPVLPPGKTPRKLQISLGKGSA